MKGKLLPIEQQVCDIVRVLINHHGCYRRKYSRKLIQDGEPTGRRNHKFYDVHFEDRDVDDVVKVINQVITFIASNYFAVSHIKRSTGVQSIVIYPWNKEVHYEPDTQVDTEL